MECLTLAPGSDRILVELFQILKDDAVESAALNMRYALNMQYAGSRHPPTFFLIPSLTIGWMILVLKCLCPLVLMGFFKEQQCLYMHSLVLIPLPLEVTWSRCVLSGIWAQFWLPLGLGVGRRLASFWT